jgi:hypothetical protein
MQRMGMEVLTYVIENHDGTHYQLSTFFLFYISFAHTTNTNNVIVSLLELPKLDQVQSADDRDTALDTNARPHLSTSRIIDMLRTDSRFPAPQISSQGLEIKNRNNFAAGALVSKILVPHGD